MLYSSENYVLVMLSMAPWKYGKQDPVICNLNYYNKINDDIKLQRAGVSLKKLLWLPLRTAMLTTAV